jgi:hypothetical protein
MRGDSVCSVEGLDQRCRALQDEALRLRTLRDRLQQDLHSKELEVEALSRKTDQLTKVSELFRVLMDLLVLKQVRSVEDIVTEGFRSIFHDQELSFESEVSPKYGKIAVDFFVRQGNKEDALSHRGKPLEAFGGGPSSVASLVLRVLAVIRLQQWPLLVLDEALGAVSEEYADRTALFLRELAQKMGIDVMLVTQTQKQSFCEHAAVSYQCSEVVDGSGRHLVLRNQRRS